MQLHRIRGSFVLHTFYRLIINFKVLPSGYTSFRDSRVSYLILVDFAVLQFGLALFLERDDDQSDEYVDEEERKHDEVYDVKQRSFDVIIRYGSFVQPRGRYGVLQYSVDNKTRQLYYELLSL